MQGALALLGLILVGFVLFLLIGPVIAGIFLLVAFLVLMVVSLPVLIVLAPWLVIGGLVWLIFF